MLSRTHNANSNPCSMSFFPKDECRVRRSCSSFLDGDFGDNLLQFSLHIWIIHIAFRMKQCKDPKGIVMAILSNKPTWRLGRKYIVMCNITVATIWRPIGRRHAACPSMKEVPYWIQNAIKIPKLMKHCCMDMSLPRILMPFVIFRTFGYSIHSLSGSNFALVQRHPRVHSDKYSFKKFRRRQ